MRRHHDSVGSNGPLSECSDEYLFALMACGDEWLAREAEAELKSRCAMLEQASCRLELFLSGSL